MVAFSENVFQATIEYDCSKIQDFDESKVHAVRRVVVADDILDIHALDYLQPEGFRRLNMDLLDFDMQIAKLYAGTETWKEDPLLAASLASSSFGASTQLASTGSSTGTER